MGRTRVKICGITQPQDAVSATNAGADAIGLVFHGASRRFVEPSTARAIVAALPPFVAAVGLFLDAEADWVHEVLAQVPLGLMQFHGSEPGSYCRSFGRPYMKSVGMAGSVDWQATASAHAGARALLVDSHAPGAVGGTGEVFDWTRMPRQRSLPIVLAGGLTADNVAAAIRQVRPDGVDVSSGVESDKGIKDEALIHDFIEEVGRGDRNRG
jgi:phosphoribosylanthranilate isomerase